MGIGHGLGRERAGDKITYQWEEGADGGSLQERIAGRDAGWAWSTTTTLLGSSAPPVYILGSGSPLSAAPRFLFFFAILLRTRDLGGGVWGLVGVGLHGPRGWMVGGGASCCGRGRPSVVSPRLPRGV
jgi:hypothetical protein